MRKRLPMLFAALLAHSAHANLLLDERALQQAQESLRNLPEWQGKVPQVYEQIQFFDGVRPRIELALALPDNPAQNRFYTYEQGRWQVSDAENISHVAQPAQRRFPLERVSFADAALAAKVWRTRAESSRALLREPYYLALVYLPKQQKMFWHTATLEAHGAQYYLSLHQDLSLWEWNDLNAAAPAD